MNRTPPRLSEPRQKRASQLGHSPLSFAEMIDYFFFIFAGVATLWLGVLLFLSGFRAGWSYWLYFIVLWAVMAYLALPRLHRTLTQIYVPNYFIGRTRTSDGLLGDPVNLAFRGNEAQLHKAMEQAGWILADDITARSTWRTIIATLRHKSYDAAPVSPLLLFGRKQDFAYQQEIDGTPHRRHHVRFWHCPKGWLLPGGHQVDWLAAGTYDKSVGVSLFTLQITHRVDENTDIERDYIVDTLQVNNKKVTIETIKDFSTGYHTRNGGGDAIITDGDLPIVELTELSGDYADELPERAGVILDSTAYESGHSLTATASLPEDLWKRRPLQLLAGGALVVMVMVMEVVQIATALLNPELVFGADQLTGDPAQLAAILTIVFGAIMVAVETTLIVLVLRGSNLARLLLLVVASAYILNKAIEFFYHNQAITFGNSLVAVSLHIGILLALSSDSARNFATTRYAKIIEK